MTRGLRRPWLAASALISLCACTPRYLHSDLAPDAKLDELSRVAVLPVASETTDRAAELYRTGRVEPGAPVVVTDLLYRALAQQTVFEPVARPRVEQALAALPEPPSSLPALQALARTLGADAILRGVVTAYREREGSHVGVTQPAAVGIELWLITARDGQVIWHGRYYEAQQSMSEELRTLPLYFKRGTRWLTAQELASYAVDELVGAMPRPR